MLFSSNEVLFRDVDINDNSQTYEKDLNDQQLHFQNYFMMQNKKKKTFKAIANFRKANVSGFL